MTGSGAKPLSLRSSQAAVRGRPNMMMAIIVARVGHTGQVDKGGAPYFDHVSRVAKSAAARFESYPQITRLTYVVGLLHDIVEDTPNTVEDVRAHFGSRVAAAVDCLTKRKGEGRADYLRRVASNPLAAWIKRCDMLDNMDLRRIPEPTAKDFARVRRYVDDLEWLTGQFAADRPASEDHTEQSEAHHETD